MVSGHNVYCLFEYSIPIFLPADTPLQGRYWCKLYPQVYFTMRTGNLIKMKCIGLYLKCQGTYILLCCLSLSYFGKNMHKPAMSIPIMASRDKSVCVISCPHSAARPLSPNLPLHPFPFPHLHNYVSFILLLFSDVSQMPPLPYLLLHCERFSPHYSTYDPLNHSLNGWIHHRAPCSLSTHPFFVPSQYSTVTVIKHYWLKQAENIILKG